MSSAELLTGAIPSNTSLVLHRVNLVLTKISAGGGGGYSATRAHSTQNLKPIDCSETRRSGVQIFGKFTFYNDKRSELFYTKTVKKKSELMFFKIFFEVVSTT